MSTPTPTQVAVYNRLTELEVSPHNQHRHIIKVLADALAPNETITAVAIGRNDDWVSALFALTNLRLFYIEGDPMYHSSHEIALTGVYGSSLLPTPILSSVTIQTPAGDYSIKDINNANSRYFMHELDKEITNLSETPTQAATSKDPAATATPAPTPKATSTTASVPQPATTSSNTNTPANATPYDNLPSDGPNLNTLAADLLPAIPVQLSKDELAFLSKHNAGILTTTSASGQIQSNPVYYALAESELYIMTREQTHKARNMIARPQATLVVMDNTTLKHVNLTVLAKETSDLIKKHEIYTDINAIISSKAQHNIQSALYDTAQGDYTVFKLILVAISENLD